MTTRQDPYGEKMRSLASCCDGEEPSMNVVGGPSSGQPWAWSTRRSGSTGGSNQCLEAVISCPSISGCGQVLGMGHLR